MKNAIELPLEEEGMYAVIAALAEAMTYEATVALMHKFTTEDINDELKAASSLFDRVTWFMRMAYISGFADGLEIYEAAYSGGELYIDSVNAIIEDIITKEYSETVKRVCDFLKLTRDIHPLPSVTVEVEEQLILPRRITRRMKDGTISLRLDEKACREKLWRYENTGFEPDDILYRANRPHINMLEHYKGEPPSRELAKVLLGFQCLLDEIYEIAYAKARKETREATGNE